MRLLPKPRLKPIYESNEMREKKREREMKRVNSVRHRYIEMNL